MTDQDGHGQITRGHSELVTILRSDDRSYTALKLRGNYWIGAKVVLLRTSYGHFDSTLRALPQREWWAKLLFLFDWVKSLD